jgi:hydrogenase expression/formation protein HypE
MATVVSPAETPRALEIWRSMSGDDEAAIIGGLQAGEPLVVLRTEVGGERLLEELEDDPLPRIF